MKRLPKAILFDHDGVLVASEPLHWAAWERLLAELGIPYNNQEMQDYVGRTAPEIITTLLDRNLPGWNRTQYDPDRLALRKNDLYLEAAQSALRPYPGVIELLDWIRAQGIRAAVVSNAKRRELDASLGLLDLRTYFDLTLSRDDVSPPKPDPAPYARAAALLQLDPQDCLAIEDSPTGLESSLLAKVPSAAVETSFPRSALEQPVPGRPDLKPLHISRSMTDLFGWLREMPA